MGFDYLRDPVEIEAESFRRIRTLTRLDRFDEKAQQIAMRLVHTAGLPEIVDNLHITDDAVDAGIAALQLRAPVLCDVEMLRSGITTRFIDSPCLCFLRENSVAELARTRGDTRCMAALDHWAGHLHGAIAAIGNAPTALFRLLEMIESGAPRPSVIIGMPVGFVGAVESKEALLEFSRRHGVPSILLRGRQGGSALAAAAVNALARLSRGVVV